MAAVAADPLREQLAAPPFPAPGGMDCAKGTAVAGLYDDLMVDILSRVPVKDLRRSKCVSRPWRDLIADPLHRKKLPQTLEGFFHGGPGDRRSYGHFTSLVNGLLHFIVFHVQKKEALVVAVDAQGKTCRIITWHDKHAWTDATFIGQSQGHLHCISVNLQTKGFRIYCTQVSVWVLEDYDTHEWILKHNVSSSKFFGLLRCPINDFDIVAIHPDHNSIILVQHWNQKLVSYDMDSKKLRALCTLGKGYRFITPYIPCFMESLVLGTKD